MEEIFTNYTSPGPTLGTKIIEFIQTLVIFAAVGTAIYLFIAQPHKVSGSSMFPTLHTGDYIITNKIDYRFNEPEKSQIIVFKNPREESQDFIKRIMAVPGDTIKVQDGHVYLKGKVLDEQPYLDPSVVTLPGSFLREGEEILVPVGRYIVIGDNRMASSDSREWGFITKEEIIGKAFLRYWPIKSFGIIQSALYHFVR